MSGGAASVVIAGRQRHRRCGGPRHAGGQRGLSLITSLLFMVAALILGVSVMSINVMQERMIGNTKDRNLATQAAEAALRDAELDITDNITPATPFADNCTAGLCTPPSQRSGAGYPSASPVYRATAGFSWEPADGMVRRYAQYTSTAVRPVSTYPTVAKQPVYVIEKLGALTAASGDSLRASAAPAIAYRITARGFGSRADTVVMLQSIYSMR